MGDEGAQQGLVGRECEQRGLGVMHEVVGLRGCEIRQGIHLGVAPDQLDGIEFRGIAWQEMRPNAVPIAHEPPGGRS